MADQKIEITVVTAVWNAVKAHNRALLERCVRSVAMLGAGHEHLIYDGGSTDGTRELLESLAREIPTLRVVSEEDKGLYDALNKGVRDARGYWVHILGSDDYIFDASTMWEVVKEASAANVDMAISPVKDQYHVPHFTDESVMRNVLRGVPYPHQGVLMTAELMRRLGGFRLAYKVAADYDICLRAHWTNAKHIHIWKPYAYFSPGGVSQSSGDVRHEWAPVVADVLGLSKAEATCYEAKMILPWRIILRLLKHENGIIRLSGKHALKRKIADIIGMIDRTGAPRNVRLPHLMRKNITSSVEIHGIGNKIPNKIPAGLKIVIFGNNNEVSFDDTASFEGLKILVGSPECLVDNAHIEIGAKSRVKGVLLVMTNSQRVTIGARCVIDGAEIGASCPVSILNRNDQKLRQTQHDVIIADGCFVGEKSSIYAGASLPNDVCVLPRSVVLSESRIEAFSLVGGYPAVALQSAVIWDVRKSNFL